MIFQHNYVYNVLLQIFCANHFCKQTSYELLVFYSYTDWNALRMRPFLKTDIAEEHTAGVIW